MVPDKATLRHATRVSVTPPLGKGGFLGFAITIIITEVKKMAVEHLNDSNFAEKIKSGVVLVDFFATWCGPCRMLTPTIEEIGAECDGSFAVYKVDIDECEDIAMDHGIMSVPTLIVFKDGLEAERMVGVQPKTAILDTIAAYK